MFQNGDMEIKHRICGCDSFWIKRQLSNILDIIAIGEATQFL